VYWQPHGHLCVLRVLGGRYGLVTWTRSGSAMICCDSIQVRLQLLLPIMNGLEAVANGTAAGRHGVIGLALVATAAGMSDYQYLYERYLYLIEKGNGKLSLTSDCCHLLSYYTAQACRSLIGCLRPGPCRPAISVSSGLADHGRQSLVGRQLESTV
jgi:hypothetical protein